LFFFHFIDDINESPLTRLQSLRQTNAHHTVRGYGISLANLCTQLKLIQMR